MSVFGLDIAEVDRRIGGPTGLQGDRLAERREEIVARAAWSGICEPGDGVAGALIDAMGPAAALRAILDQRPTERLLAAMAEASGADDAVPRSELNQAVARWQPRLSSTVVLRSFDLAARVSARILMPGDTGWPAALGDLGPYAPVALWVRGGDGALAAVGRAVALVGARASTGYGNHVAMELSAGVCDRGFAVVSGAAYGIDGAAHRAALASSGTTVAFLAGGVDRVYPAGHDDLVRAISASGAVVSELPCGAAPTKWRFLQRNRLIAASTLATVVVEAGRRSGSLNTAGHAAALGRPLGAVPGAVTSPASSGCHRLLRDYDATCVTCADDVVELAVGPELGGGSPEPLDERRTAEETRVLDALSTRTPRVLPDLAVRAGLTISEAQTAIGALDLLGAVRQRGDGWIAAAGR